MPEPQDTSVADVIGEKGNLSSLIDDAPLIDWEEVNGEPKEQNTPPVTTPSADDVKTEEDIAESPKIKVGDLELTEDEWKRAYKDSQDKGKWEKSLKRKSQIEKYIGDDEEKLHELALYATGRKELPDDFVSKLKLPETIMLEDSDGQEQEFLTKSLPKEVLDAIKWNALQEILPDVPKLKDENKELKSKLDTYDSRMQSEAMTMVENFVNQTELSIPVEEGQLFSEALAEILDLPDHKDYDKALRIKAIVSTARDTGGDLKKAYKIITGKDVGKRKVIEKIKENQDTTVTHDKDNHTDQNLTDDEKFIERMGNPKSAKINKLLG